VAGGRGATRGWPGGGSNWACSGLETHTRPAQTALSKIPDIGGFRMPLPPGVRVIEMALW